jgi:hypothetical protein
MESQSSYETVAEVRVGDKDFGQSHIDQDGFKHTLASVLL